MQKSIEIEVIRKDIKAIKEAFEEFSKEYAEDKYPKNTTAWTQAINDTLLKIAKARGYEMSSKEKNTRNSEWLYDFVWYTTINKQLYDVHLIAESEWYSGGDYYYSVRYDFEKLMVSRVPLKLMVFEGTEKEIDNYIELLKADVAACRLPAIQPDYYLFAAWDVVNQKFEVEEYIDEE